MIILKKKLLVITCIHACTHGKVCNLRMHAHIFIVCMHLYACSGYIYKMFPHIVDDYLFNKETTKSGLKRKREPENFVGTKKSKKRLK